MAVISKISLMKVDVAHCRKNAWRLLFAIVPFHGFCVDRSSTVTDAVGFNRSYNDCAFTYSILLNWINVIVFCLIASL